ncbi:hypothetical protein Q3304_08465 [Clostridioides sp. GD02377]|uniref:hypothetical protein n=1 Tax=unclassified Clostridioides TaxID=2635829 RepID=UPI0038A6D00F
MFKEWFELEENKEAVFMIKKEYPLFNQVGLEEELKRFILLYVNYLEGNINSLKYVNCDKKVEDYIEQIKLQNKIRCFNNLQFINISITKFTSTSETSVITAQIAVISEDNSIIKSNNIGIPLAQRHVYQVDYTVLKNVYRDESIKKSNEKIITDFKILKI